MFNSNYVCILHHFDTFDLENAVTLKSGSKVTEGHRNWYQSIACLWYPISIL